MKILRALCAFACFLCIGVAVRYFIVGDVPGGLIGMAVAICNAAVGFENATP